MLNFGARRKTCFLDGRQTAHFFLHGRTRGNCTVNFDGTRCSSRTESKRLYFFCNLAGCFFRFSKLVNDWSLPDGWRLEGLLESHGMLLTAALLGPKLELVSSN